jgi:hypothetical protein
MWNQIKISKLDDKLVKGLRNSKMWEWNEMLVQINFMITMAIIRICDGIKCLHYNQKHQNYVFASF